MTAAKTAQGIFTTVPELLASDNFNAEPYRIKQNISLTYLQITEDRDEARVHQDLSGLFLERE